MINVEDSNSVCYYHFDALGSVIALSDEDGNTVQTYEYTVYGQVAAEDVNHPNPITFTGRWFDTETGLYYYRARYYNPEIGRFLQTDPVRYGMNLYAYCGNNPVVYVDPCGLVSVAFYDPHESGDMGARLRQAADDFDYWIPMDDPCDVIYRLKELILKEKIVITDVYFFDHCRWSSENQKVWALEFGEEYPSIGSEALKEFLHELGSLLPENGTINFRQCLAAYDLDMLRNLAKWSGRAIPLPIVKTEN